MINQIYKKAERAIPLREMLTCLLVLACAASAVAQSSPGPGIVMTYNVNEGSDFLQVEGATTLTQFLLSVGQIVSQVQGTNPPERMQAIAQEIAKLQPELVSLQEVDQWYIGTFDPIANQCGTISLQYDMLQELLTALSGDGASYQVAVQSPELQFPPTPGLIPPSTFLCAAVTDYNIILARTDLPPWVFQWSNPQLGQYVNRVLLPTPVGPVPVPRSWGAVDAQFFGRSFRFINTHFETSSPAVRELQGGELRAGPANTSSPVIIAMDSNSQAFPLPSDATYVDFLSAGYRDVWSELFPTIAGLTCCQSEADNNPVSQLSQRIDLVLTLGQVTPLAAAPVGADPRSRTPDGLWPSDHAAVWAGVAVGRN